MLIFSRYYGFLDLSNPKHAELKNLIQQTIAYLQTFIANGQTNGVSKKHDTKNVLQNCDPPKEEPLDTILATNSEDSKANDGDSKEIKFFNDDKSQEEQYVNALCKLGHLHLLLGEYSEGIEETNSYHF